MNKTRSFEYDSVDNLTKKTDRLGRVTEYAYDKLNRQTAEVWKDGSTTLRTMVFEFDDYDQLASASDPAAVYDYVYDQLGRVTSLTADIDGLTPAIALAQAYDVAGNRTQLAAQIGGVDDFANDFAYDHLNRLTRLEQHDHPYIIFDYTPDRSRAGPQTWLSAYRGYLQADAYGAYDGIYAPGDVHEVACWAHARRKFFEAQDTDRLRAGQMLLMIRELYAIEDRAKDLAAAQRLALRQAHSVPVLAKIDAWLHEQNACADVLPRGPLGQAMGYARNQWSALCRYTTEGFLHIDNNAAERALKRVAIGRKNWLFAGNDAAGQVAAAWYSLLASAERHGVDPQHYLTSVLAQSSSADTPGSPALADHSAARYLRAGASAAA